MLNRIDLEQAIMQAWLTCDQLESVRHIAAADRGYADEEIAKDKVIEMIETVEKSHDIAMTRLWDIFEKMLDQRSIF